MQSYILAERLLGGNTTVRHFPDTRADPGPLSHVPVHENHDSSDCGNRWICSCGWVSCS